MVKEETLPNGRGVRIREICLLRQISGIGLVAFLKDNEQAIAAWEAELLGTAVAGQAEPPGEFDGR